MAIDQDQANQLVGGMARLEGKIETLGAKLDAHLSRTGDEIKALFAKSREQANKIEAIRVDYVPEKDFHSANEQNRKEHEGFGRQISGLTAKIAMWSGGLSIIAFLIGLLVKWIGGSNS